MSYVYVDLYVAWNEGVRHLLNTRPTYAGIRRIRDTSQDGGKTMPHPYEVRVHGWRYNSIYTVGVDEGSTTLLDPLRQCSLGDDRPRHRGHLSGTRARPGWRPWARVHKWDRSSRPCLLRWLPEHLDNTARPRQAGPVIPGVNAPARAVRTDSLSVGAAVYTLLARALGTVSFARPIVTPVMQERDTVKRVTSVVYAVSLLECAHDTVLLLN
jgi:hypothetical protein